MFSHKEQTVGLIRKSNIITCHKSHCEKLKRWTLDYRATTVTGLEPLTTETQTGPGLSPYTWAVCGRHVFSKVEWGLRREVQKVKDLRMKRLNETVFAYPAMTTPSWECTSHKTASECVPATHSACTSWEKGCGLYYSSMVGRQSISLSSYIPRWVTYRHGLCPQLKRLKRTQMTTNMFKLLALPTHWMELDWGDIYSRLLGYRT